MTQELQFPSKSSSSFFFKRARFNLAEPQQLRYILVGGVSTPENSNRFICYILAIHLLPFYFQPRIFFRMTPITVQEDKHNYETTAKESLRRVLQEKIDVVRKLSEVEVFQLNRH